MKYRIAKKIAADNPRSGQLRDVRHRLDTIARAIARLRKAWRHRNPLDHEERRRTGLDNNGDPRLSNGERLHPRRWVPDFFLSNQLASRYARLHYIDGAWWFKRVTPEPDDATHERLVDENERVRLELA